MPDQQKETKEKEQPTPTSAMMRYLNELMPFIGRVGATTTIGPDNSIKHSYKMPQEAQQALVKAREGNLPSYKGMDPEDVIALMGQRSKLDAQARQMPLDISQMGLQGAQAQNLQGADSRNAVDALAMLAGRAMGEQGMNERSQAQMDDRFVNRLAADKTAEQRNRDIIASREKVARIMAQAQQEKRIPSLLDLQDSFNTFQFNKKGEYIQPEPSDMKVLDKFYQQHGWDILEIPLGEYAPWFSGNQPPQNVYFAVPQGGKPSETEVMQKLTKMGYKGLVPADLKKLVR